jgi:hypothetical protein
MAKERKTKVLTYKHAHFTEQSAAHSRLELKSLLAKSLEKLSTIGDRRESLAPSGESPIWRLLGEFQIEEQFVFGVLLRYAPGTNPVFVVDDEKAAKLTVEQISAPVTSEGKRRELVDAMLFFGACDNHLVMLQSSSLRSDHLEHHLSWLLRKAGEMPGTTSLQLIDQPPKAIREKLSLRKVKELDIGGVLTPPPKAAPAESQVADKSVAASTVREFSMTDEIGEGGLGVIDALKRLLDPDKAAKIDFEKMAGANIEYVLKIKYRNQTTDDGQALLNTLGSALRHADSVDTTIKLHGGGQIKGDDLRLSGNIRLDTYNGIPVPSEVFEVIRQWLLEKLKSGEVEAS